MGDVARAVPRERWADVGALMCTDRIAATGPEREAGFARLTARRARGADEQAVAMAAAGSRRT
jgi:hypothetical protein